MRLVYEPLTDIPFGFTEVEYLQSSGTQYIDTGLYFDVTKNFEVNAVVMNFDNNRKVIIGDFTVDTIQSYSLEFGGTQNNKPRYLRTYINFRSPQDAERNLWSSSQLSLNTVYTINQKWVASTKYEEMTYNGTTDTVTRTVEPNIAANTNTLKLFLDNRDNITAIANPLRIYKLQIIQNNALVRDFIPCLDNNNVPCVYDKVEGKAYYNAGTGSFTYGRKIIPVEYLESSGTQYIDTGIKGKSGISAKTKVNYTYLSGSTSHAIGGEYTTNTSCYFGMVRANGHFTYLYKNSVVETNTTLSINTDYDIDITLNNGNQRFVINGNVVSTGTVSGDFTATNNLFLYAINSVNGADVYGSLKMYYMQIWDNGTLVRDMIPCKDENNVGFLFDRATHTAYLNAGTGSFTFGKTLPKKKLRLIMDSKRRLPKGFTEVEYLQSSGTEWIDIGTNVNTATDEIEMYFQLTDTANYKWIFGEHDNNARLGLGTGDGTNKRNVAYYNATSKVNDTEMYNSQHYYKVSSSGVYLNGTKIDNYASFSSTSTLYLFNLNLSAATYVCKGKVWAYRHKRNGVLIRDMIPCLDNNNTPCMYDLVEQKAYYNAGTGSFTYGHTITPVEYLESTGTQYINTGYNPNSNTKVEARFKMNETATRFKWLFSARNNTVAGDGYGFGCNNSGYITSEFNNRVSSSSDKLTSGVVYNIIKDKNVCTYNGTTLTNTSSTFTVNYPLYLFCLNDHGTYDAGNIPQANYYYFKIWDNGTLVRDYIPVKDENNVGYMFDTVTHSLYANAGSGAFVVGSELKDITRFLEGA